MAFFSPWFPYARNTDSLFDMLDDHPFLNFNSSFFRDANISRANRANVSETETEYKIEVEVPGYQKGEINIEFGPDGRTVTVSGRSEKSYEEGEAPKSEAPKSVTVEEAPEEGEQPAKPSESTSTAVTQASKERAVGAPAGPKYWISERSVGSFTRTFTFRTSIDHERATANLENGVLTIIVPKASKQTAKKITIV